MKCFICGKRKPQRDRATCKVCSPEVIFVDSFDKTIRQKPVRSTFQTRKTRQHKDDWSNHGDIVHSD